MGAEDSATCWTEQEAACTSIFHRRTILCASSRLGQRDRPITHRQFGKGVRLLGCRRRVHKETLSASAAGSLPAAPLRVPSIRSSRSTFMRMMRDDICKVRRMHAGDDIQGASGRSRHPAANSPVFHHDLYLICNFTDRPYCPPTLPPSKKNHLVRYPCSGCVGSGSADIP